MFKNLSHLGEPSKKIIFLADISGGGGGGAKLLSAKKIYLEFSCLKKTGVFIHKKTYIMEIFYLMSKCR